jgi:hypothetical protein
MSGFLQKTSSVFKYWNKVGAEFLRNEVISSKQGANMGFLENGSIKWELLDICLYIQSKNLQIIETILKKQPTLEKTKQMYVLFFFEKRHSTITSFDI